MADKHPPPDRTSGVKSTRNGKFKHTAKPASFKSVLGAYGLTEGSYRKVRSFVLSHVDKEPAHAK